MLNLVHSARSENSSVFISRFIKGGNVPHKVLNSWMTLPTTRSFISALFTTLSNLPPPQDTTNISNPLISANSETKTLFLTLHCLFPNELLPALDLLDRSLVTRFQIASLNSTESTTGANLDSDAAEADGAHGNVVYYVRSSQQSRAARYQTGASTAGLSYEVRLKGWNCSCPAFTFSAINALNDGFRDGVEISSREGQGHGDEDEAWSFGGLSLGERTMPVCKHLLACVLVERCQALKGCVEERAVSKEEAAAWAAAWGG